MKQIIIILTSKKPILPSFIILFLGLMASGCLSDIHTTREGNLPTGTIRPDAIVVTPSSDEENNNPKATPTKKPIPESITFLEAGLHLVYWVKPEETLYIANVEGDSRVKILEEVSIVEISLSPDGKEIAYINSEGQIRITNLYSSENKSIEQPTLLLNDFYSVGIDWHPSRTWLAFAGPSIEVIENEPRFDELPSIWISNTKNKDYFRLTDWSSIETNPVWSPDGKWLAFESDKEKKSIPGNNFVGSTEIYIVDMSCVFVQDTCIFSPRQVTDRGENGNGRLPNWSPNSQKLAYVCGIREIVDEVEYYQDDICVVDIESGDVKNLTGTSERDESRPIWSPKGNYISYIGKDDVYIVSSTGQGVKKITTSSNNDDFSKAIWSPDGELIAFSSYINSAQNYDIEIVPSMGGELKNITNSQNYDEYFVTWIQVKQ